MNIPVVHRRRPDGTLLPGQGALNPGGRTRALVELKERYLRRLPEYFEAIEILTESDNPSIQLAAIRELLDRLIGKPQVVVERQDRQQDIGQLYLAALVRANQPASNGTVCAEPLDPKHGVS